MRMGKGGWLLNLFPSFSWQEDGDSSCQLSLGAFLDVCSQHSQIGSTSLEAEAVGECNRDFQF